MKIVRRACLAAFLTTIPALAAAPAERDPYAGLLFYLGDNHFHAGYSGDNRGDGPPLAAYMTAARRVAQIDRMASADDASLREIGGYFLFMSEHMKSVPTRDDMTEDEYRKMRKQADDPRIDRKSPRFTFTAFAGGEISGMRRTGYLFPFWDDRFGHMNIFNARTFSAFMESNLVWNPNGTTVMDRIAAEPGAIGQFNHPGYGDQPPTGNGRNALYPYTTARDRVFRFIEVTDGMAENWTIGTAQYVVSLDRGYHVSPVVGTDTHRSAGAFDPGPRAPKARTVILAPSTLGLSVSRRRQVLIAAIRAGRVYATENPNLRIRFSLDGQAIGHRFTAMPTRLDVHLSIRDMGSPGAQGRDASGITRIELLAGIPCSQGAKKLDDIDVRDMRQCTKPVKRWDIRATAPNERLPDGLHDFQKALALPALRRDARYLLLQVLQKNGMRAITTPFFFR